MPASRSRRRRRWALAGRRASEDGSSGPTLHVLGLGGSQFAHVAEHNDGLDADHHREGVHEAVEVVTGESGFQGGYGLSEVSQSVTGPFGGVRVVPGWDDPLAQRNAKCPLVRRDDGVVGANGGLETIILAAVADGGVVNGRERVAQRLVEERFAEKGLSGRKVPVRRRPRHERGLGDLIQGRFAAGTEQVARRLNQCGSGPALLVGASALHVGSQHAPL